MKDLLREEYTKVWGAKDTKMVDYCVNKVAEVAVLPNGALIVVDKQTIKKDFCFGESGYDYDDAQAMASYARRSEDYFREKNMEYFNEWLKDLREAINGGHDYMLLISDKAYTRQAEDCRLATTTWVRLGEVIEACGGSVYLDELEGKTIKYRGQECRIATKEELERILKAYEDASKAHEKKVNSYLKRYGTSKVHSWTYWRDA